MWAAGWSRTASRTETRQKVAAILQQQVTFLWPTLLVQSDAAYATAVGEIDQVWPTCNTISTETWHALFSGATRQLDILVYAGAFLVETLRIVQLGRKEPVDVEGD